MDGRDNNFGIDFAPIGRAMEKQTTLDLWSVLRTEQFILLRVILAMLVVRTAMLSAAA